MAKRSNGTPSEPVSPSSISRITVSGFKSIGEEQSIEIAPLTILAGVNSSGKSSIMQPLLLLKQTLEASYDPGALMLDGPNLKFTMASQLLSREKKGKTADRFSVGLQVESGLSFQSIFNKEPKTLMDVVETRYHGNEENLVLSTKEHKVKWISQKGSKPVESPFIELSYQKLEPVAVRARCFLKVGFKDVSGRIFPFPFHDSSLRFFSIPDYEGSITGVIHLPGLRGNPLRTYSVAAVGDSFSGTFEHYTASVIFKWQEDKSTDVLDQLYADLKWLGLTWKVVAKRINETQVELHVGRLIEPIPGGSKDLVSIADVGFGVSQTLPLLVAMHVAKPGQLVYLEQPEIHLHPRAQMAMAQVIANASKRGVKVVIETHSSLLILGVQTLVAEGKLDPSLVKLHWFQRDADGMTKITTGNLDENGTFGDWPEDFADVELGSQHRFLSAFETRMGL